MSKYQQILWSQAGSEAATVLLFYAGMRYYKKMEGLQKATGYVALGALAQLVHAPMTDLKGTPNRFHLLLHLTTLGLLSLGLNETGLIRSRKWMVGTTLGVSQFVATYGWHRSLGHDIQSATTAEAFAQIQQWYQMHSGFLTLQDRMEIACSLSKQLEHNQGCTLDESFNSEVRALKQIHEIREMHQSAAYQSDYLPFAKKGTNAEVWKDWSKNEGKWIECIWKIDYVGSNLDLDHMLEYIKSFERLEQQADLFAFLGSKLTKLDDHKILHAQIHTNISIYVSVQLALEVIKNKESPQDIIKYYREMISLIDDAHVQGSEFYRSLRKQDFQANCPEMILPPFLHSTDDLGFYLNLTKMLYARRFNPNEAASFQAKCRESIKNTLQGCDQERAYRAYAAATINADRMYSEEDMDILVVETGMLSYWRSLTSLFTGSI